MTMRFDPLDHETPDADLDALSELALRASSRAQATHGGQSVALEVGSWAGRTALVLSDVFDATFCVDHWRGNAEDRLGDLARYYGESTIFRTFAKNMGDRFGRSVFACCGLSRTWASAWTRPLDLVFIDGSHDYLSCYSDIRDWGRHLRPGGTMVVHDYGVFEGVNRAVDELMPGRKRAGATLAYEEMT